jgi:hypothetical protein
MIPPSSVEYKFAVRQVLVRFAFHYLELAKCPTGALTDRKASPRAIDEPTPVMKHFGRKARTLLVRGGEREAESAMLGETCRRTASTPVRHRMWFAISLENIGFAELKL